MTARRRGRRPDVGAMERRVTIEEMWAAGATMREIAAELGTTEATVKTTMHQMRQSPETWDLPPGKMGRPRARYPASS